MDSISEAQHDMRRSYFGGATGAACSATAWLVAAMVAAYAGAKAGIIALVIGGVFIFPASVLLSKALGRSGKHRSGNPLASLALEGTIWMLLSIPIAIGTGLFQVELFFPAMLLVIGGRYLTFKTLYGMRIYWLFGAALAVAGLTLAMLDAPPYVGAFAGSIIEYVFAIAIFVTSNSESD